MTRRWYDNSERFKCSIFSYSIVYITLGCTREMDIKNKFDEIHKMNNYLFTISMPHRLDSSTISIID